MRAALLHDWNQDLELVEVDVAEPGPGEVLVDVRACGVCHSDRTVQQGGRAGRVPLVLGHEAAGVVAGVGPGVTGVSVGDHVVGCAVVQCGACEWCRRGHGQHCLNTFDIRNRPEGQTSRLSRHGEHVQPFSGLGGFATQMLLDQRAVVVLPDDMPFDRAALLGCAVHTGVGAVRHTAGVRVGETVAVIGCGGVGLNAIQGAKICGASQIIAIDLQDGKLDMAREFGATDVINSSTEDPVVAVRDLTGGGVDHAFEVVGLPVTIRQSFDMLRERGTATMVGMPRDGVEVSLPAADLLFEKRLQGSKLGHDFLLDVPWYCEAYRRGELKLDELISGRIALEDVNVALQELDSATVARNVIVMD